MKQELIKTFVLASIVTVFAPSAFALEKSKIDSSSNDLFSSEVNTWAKNQAPRESASLLAQSTPSTSVVTVTDVKLNTTDKGIEVILVTSNSQKLSVKPKTQGNSYVVNIPNARLQLASGESFRREKPVAGIASVTVANVDASTLQLTVTGDKQVPKVEVLDSETEGLVFQVASTPTTGQPTPGQTSAPTQQTTSQQKPNPSSGSKQQPIELQVVGSPDTGYRVPNATTGTRTNTANRDIPQTINVIPSSPVKVI